LSLLSELTERFYKRLDPAIEEVKDNLTRRMTEADQAEQVGRLAAYLHAEQMFVDVRDSLAHDPDDDPEEDPPNPLLEDDE
jgi:chromatin segregation and condensation protein Rec8/ScpA/Scc1 (kleisin family)